MSQLGLGYYSQALIARNSQTKDQYLTKILDKLDPFIVSQVKQTIWGTNDTLVEDLVYGRIPMINNQKFNINIIVERQRLKDHRKELEEKMRNLHLKHDLFSKKEFEDRIAFLEQKYKDIEHAFRTNPQQLEIDEVMGLEKNKHKRRFQNLADFTAHPKSKEETLKEQREAQEFIQRIKQQKKDWERYKGEIRQKELTKLREQSEKALKEREEREKAIEEERKARELRIKQELREKEEMRRKVNQETQIKVQEVLNARPLYKQKEEIDLELEKSELEQKKEKLKNLRSFMKPIDPKEIEKHKQKYLEAKRVKEQELQEVREKNIEDTEQLARQYQKRLLKYSINGHSNPKAMILYEKELQEKEEQVRQKEEEKRKIQERVQNYSRYVREMYYPKVSETKHEELELLKSKITHHSAMRKTKIPKSQRSSLANLHSAGDQYQQQQKTLKTSNSIVKLQNISNSDLSHKSQSKATSGGIKKRQLYNNLNVIGDSINEESEYQAVQRQRQVEWGKSENKMKMPQHQQIKSPQHSRFHDSTLDYLREQRARREVEGINYNAKFIESKLNDPKLPDSERLKIVKGKAHELERKAEMDEKVLRNNRDHTIEEEMAVNDMYLDAITAKLKLLDRI